LDGDQHGLPAAVQSDLARDRWLSDQGYKVVRVWNVDVMSNLEGVCEAILAAAEGDIER